MSRRDEILARLGIDAPPTQFRPLEDRTLSLDADGLLYEASSKAARLETALRSAKMKVYEIQFLTGCQFVRAHLTARGSFKAGRRLLVGAAGEYQHNRTSKPKPPLLEPLREALAQPGVFGEDDGITVLLHRDIEADDAMMMDAFHLRKVLVWSPDKDLRIVPCPWYDHATGRTDKLKPHDTYGWLGFDADKGKVIGHGTAFFWAQMLMGDTADGVKGLLYHTVRSKTYQPLRDANPECTVCGGTGYAGRKRGTPKCDCLLPWMQESIGPVGAYDLLKDCKTEDDAANLVIDLYRDIDQNPLPEACMMWLLRQEGDSAEGYIWGLNLSRANREFIEDCYNRNYRRESEDDESETD